MPVVHNLANYCGEKHASCAYWSSHDFACAQCRSQTNDLSLWSVLVHMCTKLENGILVNGQQLSNTVDSFIIQGEFEAIKTLNDRRAPHCDTHQFNAKQR